MLNNFLITIKKKWKELVIILCSILIWHLLHINNYIIKNALENNFIIILLMNIFGLIYFYNKYFKNDK